MNKQVTFLIIIICIFATFSATYAFVDTKKNEEITKLLDAYELSTSNLNNELSDLTTDLNNELSDLTTAYESETSNLTIKIDIVTNMVASIFWIQTRSPALDIDHYKKGDVEFETYLEDSYFIGNWVEENGNTYTFLPDGTYIKTGNEDGLQDGGSNKWAIGSDTGDEVLIIYTGYSSSYSCKFYYAKSHLLLSSHDTGYNTVYLKKVGQ